MGSPISPNIANIFMQDYEKRMLDGFEQSPRIWLRYVDDTLVVIRRNAIDEFLQYINNFHPSIKFTVENESESGRIQFLDCAIMKREDGRIDTSVYRKGSHSNQYLSFDSEHPLCTKKAVAKSLYRRATALCSTEDEKDKETALITSILRANGYSASILRQAKNVTASSSTSNNQEDKEWLSTVVIPYRRTTSEDIRRVLNRHKIRVAFQASNTLRKQLVKLKDPIPTLEKSNCVYRLQCKDCEASYVGQTARDLMVRVREHERCAKKKPTDAMGLRRLENDSAMAAHVVSTGHLVEFDRTSVPKHGF